MRQSAFATVLLLLANFRAHAGGTSFAVRVVAFERLDQDSAKLSLQAVDRKDPIMPSCSTVRVTAHYGPTRWAEVVGIHEPPATREEHRQALDALGAAYRDAVQTRFGLMGEGLAREPDSPVCDFHSRALKLVEEHRGRTVPYSFAKWP